MKKRFLPRARGGKLWNFSTPGFYVSPVPTSKAFYGTRGRDIMRAWRSKILKRIASPFLFLYLSYNSSRYEAARCSFTTRYVYIYIIDSNTNASALCTRSGGINYYKRSSFSFEVARSRRTMKKMKFLFFVLCVKRILRYLLSLERKMIKYLLSLFVDHRLNG